MKNAEELQEEIRTTRMQVGQDLDAIAERFTPAHIREQVNDMARNAAHKAKARTREVGMSLLGTIRENPIPAALIGAGVAWLLIERRSNAELDEIDYLEGELEEEGRARHLARGVTDRASTIASQAKEKVQHLTEQTRERISDVGTQTREKLEDVSTRARERAERLRWQARERANRAASGARNLYEDNPLAVASAVVLLGAAVGMLLPATSKEDRVLGGVRDDLLGRAKSAAKTTAEQLKETAREEGPNVKAALESAAREVKDAAERVVERTGETVRTEAQQGRAR